MPSAIPLDTDPEVYERQVASWRALSVEDRAALISTMCADVEAIARAGIARTHPDLTERQILWELARRRYGSTLADAAFGPSSDP